jgi:plasmid maintenance system killer protein
MSNDLIIQKAALKQVSACTANEQKAFEKAVKRFSDANLDVRKTMLKKLSNTHFCDYKVTWTLRANRKYRLLVDWEDDHYVVRAFVSRNHRYYC